MSHDDLSELPGEIVAGTTVVYTRTPEEFPADDGWTLTLCIRGAGAITKVGVASGASFIFTLSTTDTNVAPGVHSWFEIASKAGQSYVFDEGSVCIEANPVTAIAGDFQSFEEQLVPLLEAAILARLSGTSPAVQSYSIAGRSINFGDKSLAELRAWLSMLKRVIKRRCEGGSGFGLQVRVGFPGLGSER